MRRSTLVTKCSKWITCQCLRRFGSYQNAIFAFYMSFNTICIRLLSWIFRHEWDGENVTRHNTEVMNPMYILHIICDMCDIRSTDLNSIFFWNFTKQSELKPNATATLGHVSMTNVTWHKSPDLIISCMKCGRSETTQGSLKCISKMRLSLVAAHRRL